MSVKERVIQAIEQLPEDADFRAVWEKLDFIRAVDEGLEHSRSGRTLTPDQVRQRLSQSGEALGFAPK